MVEGLSISEVSSRLSLPKTTLERWRRTSRQGNLSDIGRNQRCLKELENELARVKKELALARMEREILKKAAAYFAKESLPGTRQ
jgi:transposase